MFDITCSTRFPRMALVVAIVLLNGCSNPPGHVLDGSAERTPDAGPIAFHVDEALDDVTRIVETTWSADRPANEGSAPAPRDWLKNLVGPGGKTDPGAPSP